MVTTILYSNQKLNWKTGEFNTSYLCNNYYYFELIEDNTIDIDSIEELNHYTVISAIEGKTEKNIDDELGKYSLAFNKLLQWAKQIDKKLKEKE